MTNRDDLIVGFEASEKMFRQKSVGHSQRIFYDHSCQKKCRKSVGKFSDDLFHYIFRRRPGHKNRNQQK